AGSARARPASSISAWCACAPPRTGAGSFAPPTTESPRPSIPPAGCAASSPCSWKRPRTPASATSRTELSTRAGAIGSRSSAQPLLCWGWLAVPYHQHIAILDDVLLAFEAKLALIPRARIAAQVDQGLPVHHFGANELLLEIGVNR